MPPKALTMTPPIAIITLREGDTSIGENSL
jgi:hypothetical protein